MKILFNIITLLTLLLAYSTTGFTQASKAILSRKLTQDELVTPVTFSSPLVIRHQSLGVISLKIESLKAHTRQTEIQGSSSSKVANQSIFLGKGIVKLRRGLSLEDIESRQVLSSLSAQLSSSENQHPPYLRIRFTKTRRSGRVFEITIPIGTNLARVRHVSLRALSSKVCGLETKTTTTSAPLKKSSLTKAATSSSTKIFTVSTDCDFECYSKLGEEQANDRILEFFNTVSTIYGNDLDFGFSVVGQVARSTTSTYPTSATNAESLLGLFRNNAPSLKSADFKHLITGKSMKASVVGLSFVGVACARPSYTLGYSQHLSSLLTPIVIAHEIGHNLNAIHDPNNQGIMTAILSDPFPTAFSSFSKTEISSYVDDLGNLACYEGASGGGSDSGSGETLVAALSTRLSNSKFTAAISQSGGSACSVTLRVARSQASLSSKGIAVFSSSITSAESLKLIADNMPKVKVEKPGQKSTIWFDVVSSCAEGTAVSTAKSLNVAIAADKAKGKLTLRNNNAWIRQLQLGVQRSS